MAKQTNKSKASEKTLQKPVIDEQTQAQKLGQIMGGISIASALGLDTLGIASSGQYKTYRKMRACPTITIARVAATAPILLANHAYDRRDDVGDDVLAFVQEQIEPLYPRLVKDMLFALDYGWQPFEKVWAMQDGRLVYDKIKALLPDRTKILVDKDSGTLTGLKNGKATLDTPNVFIHTYDAEGTDLYGRSRHENIREYAWHPWTEIIQKMRIYAGKVSGVVPIIEYSPGTTKDADGSEKSNYTLGQTALNALAKAKGIMVPNTLVKHATDLARAGVDVDKLHAWNISFLETKAGHGREYVLTLRYLDSLMLRGWLVPERSVTEGQFGTKAEAESHSELALTMCFLIYDEMLRQITDYVINPLVIYNFGMKYKNAISLTREGLDPILLKFLREMLSKVLTAPINTDLFMEMVDVNTIFDQIGIPKAKEVLTNKDKPKKTDKSDEDDDEDDKKLTMSRAVRGMMHALKGDNDNNGSRTKSVVASSSTSRF